MVIMLETCFVSEFTNQSKVPFVDGTLDFDLLASTIPGGLTVVRGGT